MTDGSLIRFDAVSVGFRKRSADDVMALRDVSFSVEAGRSLGIIGDSGAGKTTLCRVAEGILAPSAGRVFIDGKNMSGASDKLWRKARRDISLVFQDAVGSFNPMRPVFESISMPLIAYENPSKTAVRDAVGDVMERVGLRASQMTRYPHEFSGGQIQRLAIARALINNPKVVLLDEPVSALDVSIRAQILNLLVDLAETLDLTYLVISSDPSVPRYLSQEMLVLRGGQVVEAASTNSLFDNPRHPYSVSLLALRDAEVEKSLSGLSGAQYTRADDKVATGCPFTSICPFELPPCREVEPVLSEIDGHLVRCHALKHDHNINRLEEVVI